MVVKTEDVAHGASPNLHENLVISYPVIFDSTPPTPLHHPWRLHRCLPVKAAAAADCFPTRPPTQAGTPSSSPRPVAPAAADAAADVASAVDAAIAAIAVVSVATGVS